MKRFRHYFNKGIILCILFMIILFILPYGVGLKLYSTYSHHLAYVKETTINEVEIDEVILYKHSDNDYYFSKVLDKNHLVNTLMLEDEGVINENALMGKKVLMLPYLGSVFLFFIRLDYDMKLMMLLFVLIIEIMPELLNIFLKNRAFKTI